MGECVGVRASADFAQKRASQKPRCDEIAGLNAPPPHSLHGARCSYLPAYQFEQVVNFKDRSVLLSDTEIRTMQDREEQRRLVDKERQERAGEEQRRRKAEREAEQVAAEKKKSKKKNPYAVHQYGGEEGGGGEGEGEWDEGEGEGEWDGETWQKGVRWSAHKRLKL
jgi:hypothetical protein